MLQDQTLTEISDRGVGGEAQLMSFLEKISFSPSLDIPLTIGLTILLLLHFRSWANTENADTTVDLPARLPMACVRGVLFTLALFAFCYFANIGIWVVFATLVVVGVVVSVLLMENMGLEWILGICGLTIREACFGFPMLIHRGIPAAEPQPNPKNELIGLVGTTTSPLRPSGYIDVNGAEHPAGSESGEMIDAGSKIIVSGMRNGQLLVRVEGSESSDRGIEAL